MYYGMVIAATVLLAFDFALNKKYQLSEGADLTAGLRFNALNGLFTAIIFFCLNGFRLEFSVFSLILALGMSLCGVLYNLIGFRILRSGSMALYSLFLMSGGMLLPYVFGILFLDESPSALRICGVILILAAVILSNRSKLEGRASLYALCAAVFVLNGSVSILSKFHQIGTEFAAVSSTAFVMYSGIGKFLLCSGALLCVKERKRPAFSRGSTVLLVMGSALIGGVSYMLQLVGAKALPASVLYPIVTGGSVIFSALSGRVFFKEKLTPWQIASIVLCFIGTLLFL